MIDVDEVYEVLAYGHVIATFKYAEDAEFFVIAKLAAQEAKYEKVITPMNVRQKFVETRKC